MKKRIYFLLMVIAWCSIAYAQAPTITSFSPAKGAVGTLVTITGTNLNAPTAFAIGGVPAVVVSNTPTTLVGMVMPDASTGNITLSTAGGTANSASNFTVTPTQFPSAQMGEKLVGTGNIGAAAQGEVDISSDGKTAVIGGSGDNGGAGAAWIFVNDEGVWKQQAKLIGTGNIGAAGQGNAVAINADGNTVAISGSRDNGGIGAVWVFIRVNDIWIQQGNKLVGTGSIGTDPLQGFSIDISANGNTIIFGGVDDNRLPSTSEEGAAWVFVRNNGVWTQQGNKLVGTGSIGGAGQGWSVAISADGNTAIVGGWSDNDGIGASWIFTRNNSIWTQQGNKLVGTDVLGAAQQGVSVSLSADGNTALIGGYVDNKGLGASWIFTRNNGVWTQQGNKLVINTNKRISFQNIRATSADGNIAVATANEQDNSFGSIHFLFTRNNGIWIQQENELVGTGNQSKISFARLKISSDGRTIISGGFIDNNNQGAAWVFTVRPPTPVATAVSNPSTSGFTANWSSVEDVFSYKIDVAIDPDFNNILSSYENLDVKGTSLAVTGLSAGITYYYRVRSSNGAVSFNSNVVSVAVPKGPEINVVNPKTGDYLQYRTFYTLSFNSNINASTKIELIGGDRTSAYPIAEVPRGLGSYRWYVPASLAPKGNYKILVSSTVGTTTYKDESDAFSIGIEPPETKITANFPASIPYQSSKPLDISVEVGSSLRSSEVLLYYRNFSSSAYKIVKVTPLAADASRFANTIPYSEFDQLGMEYYYEFSKDNIVQARSELGRTTIQYPNLEIPYTNFGKNIENYEMIAIPLNLKDNKVVDVFKDELGEANVRQWRTFRYANGSTAAFEGADVKAGESFWFIAKDNPNKPIMTGEGTAIPTSTDIDIMHKIPVKKGWNQIGNPYLFPLDFGNLQRANQSLNVNNLQTFEKGSFVGSSQLKPFQGGFVFVENDGELKFPPAPFDPNSGGRTEQEEEFSNTIESENWQVRFNLLSSATKDVIFSKDNIFAGTRQFSYGGFGMHPQASKSKDSFDALTPPRFLEHLEINFMHPEYFYPYFSKDVVPTQESYVWEFSIESGTDGLYKTLSWEKIEAKEGKNLILFDVEKNIRIDMSKETAYPFDLGTGTRKFKVYFGNENFLKENILPEIASVVAYPNPFADDLKFNVSITEKSKAYLQIYNSVGQVVLSEEKTFEQAGFYVWDLSSSVGSSSPTGGGQGAVQLGKSQFSSGIYFYQIQVVSSVGITAKQQFSGKLVRE